MDIKIFPLLPHNWSHPSCGIVATGKVQRVVQENHMTLMTDSVMCLIYPPLATIFSVKFKTTSISLSECQLRFFPVIRGEVSSLGR